MMIPDWAKLKPINSVTTNNTGGMMITQEMVKVAARMIWPPIEALADLFERAIRNLKDKTDEAHNG